MVVLKTFCYCGTLRTGAITAAVLNALSVAVCFSASCISFINASHYEGEGDNGDLAQQFRIDGVEKLVAAIIGVIVVIFLCLGIQKRKPGFIIPWLVVTVIQIIGLVILLCIAAAGSALVHQNPEVQLVLCIVGIIFLVALVWTVYMWLVVYSFYRSLTEQPGQIISYPVPMTDPEMAPPPFYGPAGVKEPPPFYSPVVTDNQYPVDMYQKQPQAYYKA